MSDRAARERLEAAQARMANARTALERPRAVEAALVAEVDSLETARTGLLQRETLAQTALPRQAKWVHSAPAMVGAAAAAGGSFVTWLAAIGLRPHATTPGLRVGAMIVALCLCAVQLVLTVKVLDRSRPRPPRRR